MEEYLKLKGKFTQRWLSRSDEYYSPIFCRLFYAQCSYLDKKGYCFPSELLTAIFNAAKEGEALEDIEGIDELIAPLKDSIKAKGEAFDMNEFRAMVMIQLGLGDFVEIETSINALNRGFIKLLEAAEPLAAMPLIRLQLENLTFLKAELMYPFRVLYRVFNEGKQLNDIKIKGKPLVASKIREELKDSQCDYNEIYSNYCGFVHPSSDQTNFSVKGYYSYKEGRNVITKAEIKRLCSDMIKVNLKITRLLQCQIFSYNSENIL